MALPGIWLITMPEAPRGPISAIADALADCPAGVAGVQLRAPAANDRQLVAWGRELRELTRQAGAPFLVNRRPDVAAIVEADGVHLPEAGLSARTIASAWPRFTILGVSRHSRAGLLRASQEGATFAFLSPLFAVPGKGEPIGLEGFEEQIAGVGLPTYALGGIQPKHVGALLRTGAAGVAVRRAIYDAHRPAEVMRQFVDALDKSASREG
jgi:thiamine-phosphate pyrophosphorylase